MKRYRAKKRIFLLVAIAVIAALVYASDHFTPNDTVASDEELGGIYPVEVTQNIETGEKQGDGNISAIRNSKLGGKIYDFFHKGESSQTEDIQSITSPETQSSMQNNLSASEETYGTFEVERVVDGDTFIINGDERVRMLEVDTPESVHPDEERNEAFGKVASNYTKERIEGKTVTLTFDKEHEDKYGRTLCYVYLEDGTFYNKELVEKGYAKALIMSPNTLHKKEIKKAEKKAKKEKLGLWAK